MTYTIPAYAKLNLTLDILRRRDDGYHDLDMVMQTVSLHDTVTLTCGTGTGDIVVHSDCGTLPNDARNIAYRAADCFFQQTQILCDGVDIHIAKRIPMEAGMAGGSADGAAVLRGLRTHYAPQMSMETLAEIGALVGSDVPFCVHGGTMLAQGRGEILSPLPSLPHCHICVCKPGFGLSTPALFGRVKPETFAENPSGLAMEQGLKTGDLRLISQEMTNAFETLLAPEEALEIFAIQKTMAQAGALGAMMTGSGPTVFGLFVTQTQAQQAQSLLKNGTRFVCLTTPV